MNGDFVGDLSDFVLVQVEFFRPFMCHRIKDLIKWISLVYKTSLMREKLKPLFQNFDLSLWPANFIA